MREWALDPAGWKLKGDKHNKIYNLSEIEAEMETEPVQDRKERDDKYNRIFYKERGVKEDDLTQNLIVTYSVKYRDYQRKVRSDQINRAQRTITSDPGKLKKINANDYRRFIKRERLGKDGEKIQGKEHFIIDSDQIAKEAAYDGFYAVCTNLSDDAQRVADISHRRWEIEECFRIMKSEFKARPVFLRREERIKAHFLTCFISLLIYRILERKAAIQIHQLGNNRGALRDELSGAGGGWLHPRLHKDRHDRRSPPGIWIQNRLSDCNPKENERDIQKNKKLTHITHFLENTRTLLTRLCHGLRALL